MTLTVGRLARPPTFLINHLIPSIMKPAGCSPRAARP